MPAPATIAVEVNTGGREQKGSFGPVMTNEMVPEGAWALREALAKRLPFDGITPMTLRTLRALVTATVAEAELHAVAGMDGFLVSPL